MIGLNRRSFLRLLTVGLIVPAATGFWSASGSGSTSWRSDPRVAAVFESLSERDREVFRLRRLVAARRTLSEVGAQLGLSRERVRQIDYKVLRRLKRALA